MLKFYEFMGIFTQHICTSFVQQCLPGTLSYVNFAVKVLCWQTETVKLVTLKNVYIRCIINIVIRTKTNYINEEKRKAALTESRVNFFSCSFELLFLYK